MLRKDNKHLSATMNQLKANTKQNTVSVSRSSHHCPLFTNSQQLSISALDDAICCDVCTHTMWSPYMCVPLSYLGRLRTDSAPSLSNCGHTFCQGCLTDWFNTTLAHRRQVGARGMAPYTCPSCRLPARTPPVQNFSLKRIVRLAAESRGESSPRRPQAPPPPPMPPMRGRGGARRDSPPGPFDNFFWR